MSAFKLGGSVLVDTTGVKIDFEQKKHGYTLLNLSGVDVFVQFNGQNVTANKTDLGEGKMWMINTMGIEIPSEVNSLFIKTAAGSGPVLVVRKERDE